MANDFGLSFVPTDQGTQQPGRPGGLPGGGVPPIQQAIQMLSLRLPHVLGAQAVAPGPLLTSAGGGGMNVGAGGGSLEAILRMLFGLHQTGAFGTPASPSTRPGATPMPPLPRVTPGIMGPDLSAYGQRPGVPPLPNAGGWPGGQIPPPAPTRTPTTGGPGTVQDGWRTPGPSEPPAPTNDLWNIGANNPGDWGTI